MKRSVLSSVSVLAGAAFFGISLAFGGDAQAKPLPPPPSPIQQGPVPPSEPNGLPPAPASTTTPATGAGAVLTIPPPPPVPPAPPPSVGAPPPVAPPPGAGYPPGSPYEPPLPPRYQKVNVPDDPGKTRVPDLSLWLGARLGYDLPLGAAFRDAADRTRAESSFVGQGPLLQLDAGVRVGRKYVPFVFYARTFGAAGTATTSPGATRRIGLPDEPSVGSAATVTEAHSDLVGLGVRYLFSPDDWGAAVEISYAYRFTRATFSDGAAYKADAPGVLRLAAGVDIRTGRLFSLTPMVIATVGSYADVTVQRPGGAERNVLTETMTNGYLGASLGGSFDLFSKWE